MISLAFIFVSGLNHEWQFDNFSIFCETATEFDYQAGSAMLKASMVP